MNAGVGDFDAQLIGICRMRIIHFYSLHVEKGNTFLPCMAINQYLENVMTDSLKTRKNHDKNQNNDDK